VRIEISDHGPGVPPEMLTRLFEPFVRVDEARERSGGGYGLGLAIADRAVRLHGGTITATNPPGGGLGVTIDLPVTNSTSAYPLRQKGP
jgi:two-component system sensor histidine kinase CpxA